MVYTKFDLLRILRKLFKIPLSKLLQCRIPTEMAEEYTEEPIRGGHVIDEAKPGTMDREIVEYLKVFIVSS